MLHNVLLVEPNQLLRQGLRALLNAEPDFQIVGEAQDALGAINAAGNCKPDVVLTEIALASDSGLGGIEALSAMKRRCPQAVFVVLTTMQSLHHVREALSLGVNAFIVKENSFDQVLVALRSAARGHTYLSPEISGHVVRQYLDPRGAQQPRSQLELLTHRERSIMRLIAEGRTNRSAAEILHLSPKTVEKHRANVMRKLGLSSVTELAMLAMELQLIERPPSVKRAFEGMAAMPQS